MIIKQFNYKKNNRILFKRMSRIYNSKLYKNNSNLFARMGSIYNVKLYNAKLYKNNKNLYMNKDFFTLDMSNIKPKKIKTDYIKSTLSDSGMRMVDNYLPKNGTLKQKFKTNLKKILKQKQKSHNRMINWVKNKQLSRLKKKLAGLKSKIKFSRVYKKFVKNSMKSKVGVQARKKTNKNKNVLPWILQGRREQLKLERALKSLLFWLKRSQTNKKKIPIITPEYSTLIKQYKKKAKFGKFGRYGTHAQARVKSNKLIKFNSKIVKSKKIKIKRQQIYLQNKRLLIINNAGYILSYKYIYMLIVIWYILNNMFLNLQKKIFNCEIWLNYFLRNLWIQQTCYLNNNGYLNYGTITSVNSINSIPQPMTLYTPINYPLNYQLKPLRNFDRLVGAMSNKQRLINIKNMKSKQPVKRKSKIRRFFKISPKLKTNKKVVKFFFNKKTKKKVKMQKRLSAQEWLLMSKFTRKKYQDKFSTVFSQWKNVKQIKKYINKQSQVWHQPYFITHPYYYTNRYNTFIYQLA